jgi:deoxyribodipyrimidine photolyase-related protein
MSTLHVLVLGDQLTYQLGPLSTADPGSTVVVMIESQQRARKHSYHKQKLALLYSAMRHFAAEVSELGFTVCCYRTETFAEGIALHLHTYPHVSITVMEPSEYGVVEALLDGIVAAGGQLQVVPNALWLSSDSDWRHYSQEKRQWRMEMFYRQMRRATGWMVDPSTGEPLGGQWNFDADNRKSVPPGHVFPAKLRFTPDHITTDTIDWVLTTFPDHFGDLSHDTFCWPVNRHQALVALEHFLHHRLANFGPYEDAMVAGESQLYHSFLSPALNLGLLSAKEVCEAALAYALDDAGNSKNGVPLASIEGFIRQILGWREFIRHVYWALMPEFIHANALDNHNKLPDLYWTGNTSLFCLKTTIRQVIDTGHSHHIQRLMVLGNFALLAGVSPQAINNWFLLAYVDAFEWVVTPNVIGMSQFADFGTFTTKPYISGGAYINKMSNFCSQCQYNPKLTTGPNACPFSSLYWQFIHRYKEVFIKHPRLSMMIAAWDKRNPHDQAAILNRADEVLALLARDQL